MAELTISATDIEGAIEDYVSSFTADTEREEIGTVIDAGDGIAHVEGLPSKRTEDWRKIGHGKDSLSVYIELAVIPVHLRVP